MAKKIFLNFALPITLGTLIYLLFRDKNLLVFHWANALGVYLPITEIRPLFAGMSNYLPPAIIYSLPNGLWAYSFMFFITNIWRDDHGITKSLFLSLVCMLSLGSELGQLVNIIPGTFCLNDLMFYSVGLLLGYVCGNKNPFKENSLICIEIK